MSNLSLETLNVIKFTLNMIKFTLKAAPTRASNLCKLVCTNCLTTAPDGTSMWRKPSACSSYGVNFFNSFLEHALIELFFFILHISFRRLDTFPCICSVIWRSVHFSCSCCCTQYLSHTIAQGVTYILL